MKAENLPTFGRCSQKLARGETLTALEQLIHDNEPAVNDEKFREQVAAAITEEIAKNPKPSVTLSDFEIKDAHEFLGGDVNGCDYVIEWLEEGTVIDDDKKPLRAGYYISLLEYPDEGCSLLGPDDPP